MLSIECNGLASLPDAACATAHSLGVNYHMPFDSQIHFQTSSGCKRRGIVKGIQHGTIASLSGTSQSYVIAHLAGFNSPADGLEHAPGQTALKTRARSQTDERGAAWAFRLPGRGSPAYHRLAVRERLHLRLLRRRGSRRTSA